MDYGRKAAHPNARYRTPAFQCPVIDPQWENPKGVPICAILFVGCRPTLVPMVTEAFNWKHGVFTGSIIGSQLTAVADGTLGAVRCDPFTMHPFCGYNMADSFGHWVTFRKKLGYLAQKIFYTYWLRIDAEGWFIWPAFGGNFHVLKCVCDRVDGAGIGEARPTPLGYLLIVDALDTDGINTTPLAMYAMMSVDQVG